MLKRAIPHLPSYRKHAVDELVVVESVIDPAKPGIHLVLGLEIAKLENLP